MSDVTRDGSPVEMYARMPTFGEPEIVHAAIPAGAEILELGSGAGRMTHRLLEFCGFGIWHDGACSHKVLSPYCH